MYVYTYISFSLGKLKWFIIPAEVMMLNPQKQATINEIVEYAAKKYPNYYGSSLNYRGTISDYLRVSCCVPNRKLSDGNTVDWFELVAKGCTNKKSAIYGVKDPLSITKDLESGLVALKEWEENAAAEEEKATSSTRADRNSKGINVVEDSSADESNDD